MLTGFSFYYTVFICFWITHFCLNMILFSYYIYFFYSKSHQFLRIPTILQFQQYETFLNIICPTMFVNMYRQHGKLYPTMQCAKLPQPLNISAVVSCHPVKLDPDTWPWGTVVINTHSPKDFEWLCVSVSIQGIWYPMVQKASPI